MCFDVDIRAEVTSLVPTEIVGASEHNTHIRTLQGQKNHLTIHSHIIQSSFHDQATPSQEAGISYNVQSKKIFLDTERHLHEAFSPTMAHAPVKLMRHLRHFAFQMNILYSMRGGYGGCEGLRMLQAVRIEWLTREAWLPYRRRQLQSWRRQLSRRPEYHISTTSEIAFSFKPDLYRAR